MGRPLAILKLVEKIKMGCGCSGDGKRKKSPTEIKNDKSTNNFSSRRSKTAKPPSVSTGGSRDENWYIKYRTMKCNSCDFNKDGICKKTAERYGEDKASIEDGVQRKSLKCPNGEWPRIAVLCPVCNRMTVVDEYKEMCFLCFRKKNKDNT
jgi:uncharacterized CHY-type Zn-finger protein